MTPDKIKANAMDNIRRLLRHTNTTTADQRFLSKLQTKIGAGSVTPDEAVMALVRLCRPGMAEWDKPKA